jgi:hypothetical protein
MLVEAAAASPHSVEYATVSAQLVPVFLLAAVVVPLRLERGRADSPKAMLDLLLTAVVVGTGALAETVALFGVHQGALTRSDDHLLTVLLLLTGLLAMTRLLTPAVRAYAGGARVPEGRVWRIAGCVFVGAYAALLYALS